MDKIFKTEEEAVKWIANNVPFAVKPKKIAKTKFIYPFATYHAHDQVVNSLGKSLFKYQEEQTQQQ